MPAKPVDATGERFGSLTAIRNTFTKLPKRRTFIWEFKCDCGEVVLRDLQIVKQHRTKHKSGCNSCIKINTITKSTTHGDSNSCLYSIHRGILKRCYNSTGSFKNYGAKGVIVEDYLHDYINFKEYVTNLDSYKEGLSLDRIDAAGDYTRGNLRWVTQLMQARNKRDKEGELPLGVNERFINGNKYYRASYTDESGNVNEICRSCKKYGDSAALDYVIKWRAAAIQYLITLDIGYTENHGNIKEYL